MPSPGRAVATLRLHAEGRPSELHRDHADNDQNDCHARAESHYQGDAGGKSADGCGQKQQGNRIPARNHAPGKAEADQAATVDRGRRQLVVVVLEVTPERTANPPQAGRADHEAGDLGQGLMRRADLGRAGVPQDGGNQAGR